MPGRAQRPTAAMRQRASVKALLEAEQRLCDEIADRRKHLGHVRRLLRQHRRTAGKET